MPQVDDIVERIYSFLESQPHQQAPGATIADHIRQVLGGFDAQQFGVQNLREFIARYAPRITRVGLAGMDNVYGFVGAWEGNSFEPHSPPPATVTVGAAGGLEPQVLRSFSSPNSPLKLYVHPETNECLLIPAVQPPPRQAWIEIPSCTVSDHASIAKEFLATLSDELVRQELDSLVESGTGPQSQFFVQVKERGLTTLWLTFRRDALYKRLREALRIVGVERPVSRPTTKPAPATRSGGFRPLPPTGQLSDASLRAVAVASIQSMSIDDLRRLRLPLGVVFDVLNRK